MRFSSLFGGDLILSGLIDFCFQLLDEYSQSPMGASESSFSVIELLKTLASKWLSDIVRVRRHSTVAIETYSNVPF